uniref:Uncharacterized protein n=1 Tax=Myotis myotis TaxID=51298 RepID=A0A7J7Z4Y1_MYOMY|nr:hypothetical protein mMyoMyo1_010605 [Myotis myotis]
MSREGPRGSGGGGPPMPAEGRGRRKGRKSNCSSMKWKDPQRLQLCSWEAPGSPPGTPLLWPPAPARADTWLLSRTLLARLHTPLFHLLFQAPVPQAAGQTEQPRPPPSEHPNAGWPTSPSAS